MNDKGFNWVCYDKTIELETKVLNIIKKYPNGVMISDIRRELEDEHGITYKKYCFNMKISDMLLKRKCIKRISYGIYVATKDNLNDAMTIEKLRKLREVKRRIS